MGNLAKTHTTCCAKISPQAPLGLHKKNPFVFCSEARPSHEAVMHVAPCAHGPCTQVAFILESLSDMLGVKVRRSDVLSTWTGIRPLASNPKATNTQSMVRDHSECKQGDDCCIIVHLGQQVCALNGCASFLLPPS